MGDFSCGDVVEHGPLVEELWEPTEIAGIERIGKGLQEICGRHSHAASSINSVNGTFHERD
jgi:hypothetical protein